MINLSLLSEIVLELEALEVLKEASKARSMIWDIQAKERLALALELPIGTYYYIEYEKWIEIKNTLRYLK